MPRIAILGDFKPENVTHLATGAAIQHSSRALKRAIESEWVSTDAVDSTVLKRFDGLWVSPGSPYKNIEGALGAIRYAREYDVPCFGTCAGFQHMVLEYARNVLNFKDAQDAEYDPYASDLFITPLSCSLVGREMRLDFAPDSRTAAAYGSLTATEKYYCNFGVNPDKVESLRNGPLRITGSDAEGEVRVVELPSHRFFLSTLFVPQTRSTPETPHPLVTAFLKAVAR